MSSYIIRRCLRGFITLWLVVTCVFLLLRLAPSNPAVALLGEHASEQAIEALQTKMGLNRPIWIQYADYFGNLLQGGLGNSIVSGNPIINQVARALPYSLELTLTGCIMGAIFGIPLGIIGALNRNFSLDYITRVFSLVGVSLPSFYIGILLLLLFSLKLNLFPAMGAGGFKNFADNLSHLVLPALSLAIIMLAYLTRVTRSATLEVLGEDYVSVARSKGLSERVVIYKHALRNALVPVLSTFGLYVAVLLGSSLMVEIVFSRPGIGKLMIGAVNQRDYTILQSVVLIYSGLVVIINLLTDLSYGLVDPRIRYG